MSDKNYQNSFGAGNGYITPQRANMNQMAKGGGLMGFMTGGSVIDGLTNQQKASAVETRDSKESSSQNGSYNL
jgi:hypothetical protein